MAVAAAVHLRITALLAHTSKVWMENMAGSSMEFELFAAGQIKTFLNFPRAQEFVKFVI